MCIDVYASVRKRRGIFDSIYVSSRHLVWRTCPDGRSTDNFVSGWVVDQVLFWSDAVEHEVVATSTDAPPRVAVSFWFHEDLSPAIDGECGGMISPLLEDFRRVVKA